MATTESAKAQLAKRQQGGAQTQQGDSSVAGLVAQMKPQIERALPKAMDADRFTRLMLTTLRTNPALAQCSGPSLLAACMLSAQLGLEPGPLGMAYFVPFKKDVTFIIGYRGMLELARRSGEIQSIEAREVCTNDRFEFEFGLEPKLKHVPASGDRGEPTHYYGIAQFKDGGHYFEVLSKADVDSYRERSKASSNGPWVTDYSAMARKTVIRRMAPYLPLSVEAARAVASDEGIVARLDELGEHDTEVQTKHDDIEVESVVRNEPEPEPQDDEPDPEDPDSLRKPQLVKRLRDAGLDWDGKLDELRERWKAHLEDPSEGAATPDGDPRVEPDTPPESDQLPAQSGEVGDDIPSVDPSPDIDQETGEKEGWREHAERLEVKVLPILQRLRDELPDDVAAPANSKGIDHLYEKGGMGEVIHRVIAELGSS